ncbi:hypothetical protein [Bradyrhizobium sp. MOS002]|uniref:hypothetical protein n=1 Tax=Bradyrhizobium sp. MOS002 TaxID=2133947 RepID=UPI000D127666|nr:hypothetical protein [Bradyrhizobium sp. MOS002]PSO31737.1 hypothetical protein C7G41_17180 [Bradyrhizobium sp. MOS002]
MADMIAKCMAHAALAARHGKMKGLDREKLGHAMMAEAVALSFDLDRETALLMTKHAIAYLNEMMFSLMRQKVVKDGGDIGEFEAMLEKINAERPDWMRTDPLAVNAAVQKLAGAIQLLDSTRLPPVV